MKRVTEIYKDTLKRQGLDTTEADNYRGYRDKFNFLMNNILFRDKHDFGSERITQISDTEAPYIEELLFRATSGNDEDKLFVAWFNGSIDMEDYETIFELGKQVENILTDVYCESKETDEVTLHEWIAALQASLHFDTALTVLKIKKAIYSLEIATSGIAHNIPFGQMISEQNGHRVCTSYDKDIEFDVSSAPITEVFKYCQSREDYMNVILDIIELMNVDASNKTISMIKKYAEIKGISGVDNIDELMEKDYCASEYLGYFNEIHGYLLEHPDTLSEIEKEIGTENLLDFFKVSGRNAGRKKKRKEKMN